MGMTLRGQSLAHRQGESVQNCSLTTNCRMACPWPCVVYPEGTALKFKEGMPHNPLLSNPAPRLVAAPAPASDNPHGHRNNSGVRLHFAAFHKNREGLVKNLILISATTLVLGSTAVSANAQTQAPGSGWACGAFEYANRCNAFWRFTSQRCECLGAASKKFLRDQALISRGERVPGVNDSQSIHAK
jgi:hypothetical protein